MNYVRQITRLVGRWNQDCCPYRWFSGENMLQPNNPILSKMLERLFAAMLNGPSMNCRPHASRQRLDLLHLGRLRDMEPGDILLALLGKEPTIKLAARVPVPVRKPASAEDQSRTPEQVEAQEAYDD